MNCETHTKGMNRERRGWKFHWLGCFVLGIALLLLPTLAAAQSGPACTAARFTDWRNLSCKQRGQGFRDLPCPCPPQVPSAGMPRWLVSEPYENVWVTDTPLSYPLSHGGQMSFTWTHKQRWRLPDVTTYFYNWVGDSAITNSLGRDNSSYRDRMTFGATNAAWVQSWLSDIVFWDYAWEEAWWLNLGVPTAPNYGKFAHSTFDALWSRADGGVLHFNSIASGALLNDASLRLKLEPLSALGYPTVATPVAAADGLYWGGSQTNGFRVVLADGSQEIYGLAFALYTGQNSTSRAMLTQRIDPQGRVTRIGYELAIIGIQSVFRPVRVVDSDGRTNIIRYVSGQRWQVSEIEDPYGRKMRMEYSGGPGPSRIIDAASLTNSFAYNTGSGWLTNYTTPYGTTGFEYFEERETNEPEYYRKRAVRVTEADGSKQLFLYHHKTDFSTPSSVSPVPSVSGLNFDEGTHGGNHQQLYHRNSFHWNARQYEALRTMAGNWFSLSSLLGAMDGNASAYRLAHLQHWLLGSDLGTCTEYLSVEREPSLDAAGTQLGAWTFYAYGNSSTPELEPNDPYVTAVARVLPDGSTWFQSIDAVNYTTGQPTRRRESYTLPDGSVGARTNWFSYPYTGPGVIYSPDLTSVSNSFDQVVKYTWNTNHQILGLTNALNQSTVVAYDDATHLPTSAALIGGQAVSLTYYPSNATTMNGGFLQTLQWNPGPTWNFGYDKGLVKYATNDLGLWLTFTWDGLLRPTSISYPDGTYTSNRYDKLDLVATRDRLGNWTTAGYDAMQHPTAITNANGAVTRLDWCGCGALESIVDALTNTTLFYYNNQGVLTNRTTLDFGLGTLDSTSYIFDDAQRLSEVRDGLNRSLKLDYNNQGQLTTVSNAYGLLERVVFDAVDRPIQLTDANNVTVTNTFDLLNRLTARVWPDGFGESFGWSTNGLVAATNRNQQVTRYLRDAAGRLLAVTNANLEVTRVFYNSLGQITNLWDGLDHQTQFGFDEYGRRRSRTDALGRPTYWDYNPNGWLTNHTTPQFGSTVYSYDNVGNLTAIVHPTATVTYYYDLLNRLTNMVDAVGVTAFGWNANSQLTSEDGPWTGDETSYSYEEGLRTDMNFGALGQRYLYDAAWRLTTIGSLAGTFSYGYSADSASALVRTITLPNLATITNHFDSLGRLDYTALKNKWGHPLDAYSYAHDLLGLRTNITRDFGWTTSSVTAGYDNIGQLTMWNAKETSGALRLNEQFGWNFDKAGNLNYRTNGILLQTFTSDNANQLSSVVRTGPLTVTGNTPAPATNITVNGNTAAIYGDYTFARTNNSIPGAANAFTIIAQNAYGLSVTNAANYNLPTSISSSYDLNGNLTNDGLRSFSYDFEDRLTTNWIAGQWKTEFVYDGLGRRRITRDYGWSSGWVMTNETRLICDGLLPIQERDAGNSLLVTYTRGLDLSSSFRGAGGIGGLLARTDHQSIANNQPSTAYYHSDGVGNITALMDGNGDVVGRYLYNPFGKLVGKWGALAGENAMQFSSMPEHRGLSLYFARPYDVNLQRWLTRDPIGELGGINLYGFVGNHPLNAIDPLGFASYGNPVSGPNGPVGPSDAWSASLYYPNGYMFVPNTGPVYGDPVVEQLAQGTVMAGSTLIPGVGEAMDADVLFGRGYNWNERIMAAGSLFANFATYGFLPNYGALKCPPKIPRNPFHHIFPQRPDLAAEFRARGINPHDFTMQLPKSLHQEIHSGGPRGGAWNKAWEDFFKANPGATATDIYREAGWLIYQFELPGGPIVPYHR